MILSPLQLAPKLRAAAAARAFEDSEAYATEEGDHIIHKVSDDAEDWEDHSAHLAELIAKVGLRCPACVIEPASRHVADARVQIQRGYCPLSSILQLRSPICALILPLCLAYQSLLSLALVQLAPKLKAAAAARTFEDSEAYATEEGDHIIHKVSDEAEDWEDHAAHLAELIAKASRAGPCPCTTCWVW